MIVPLLHQWTKANALFKPPVINQCRTIELKLTKLWHKAVETSLGKGNLARKNEFLHTLDTLFDILTCKCSIQLCSESNCSHSDKRENNSHIDCGCPREKKIPVLELEFIKAQRTKAEGQGSMQMGSIDYSETKKQIANAKKREQIREREQKKKMKSEEAIQREEELCQDVYHFFDSSSDEQEATSDDIPPINVNATKLSELVDLSLEVLEPPLTTSLTSQELRNLKETPMQVPKWPSHTQSVERCVKMVTEAAGHVYSHERREDKELINDMIVPLLHQWTKANALFKPPVINQCRTIELKLTKLWHKAVETSLGKGNLARKNEFLHTLDTLFDILTCKCSIQLCSESNCSHSGKRENNSHIDCGCPREKKIPVLELEFIKAQRTKAEGQGSMQMGSIDYSETKKQIANAKKREQIREREQKKKMKSEEAIQREEELCQDVYHFFDSSSDEQEATSDDIPPINVNATKLSELVDLSLEVLEPPLTTSLTSQELRNLKETPMQVPKWPSHTQSVERCVKMVTEAAGHVYSHERRE
ncbi:hypothetical protein Hamer_G028115, partial [Homarus americanus]